MQPRRADIPAPEPIVALKAVIPEDELMMITRQGVTIRLPLGGIRVIGRNTRDVPVA
jgi:DNA gyrase/topoisomerase IV subunit A